MHDFNCLTAAGAEQSTAPKPAPRKQPPAQGWFLNVTGHSTTVFMWPSTVVLVCSECKVC